MANYISCWWYAAGIGCIQSHFRKIKMWLNKLYFLRSLNYCLIVRNVFCSLPSRSDWLKMYHIVPALAVICESDNLNRLDFVCRCLSALPWYEKGLFAVQRLINMYLLILCFSEFQENLNRHAVIMAQVDPEHNPGNYHSNECLEIGFQFERFWRTWWNKIILLIY